MKLSALKEEVKELSVPLAGQDTHGEFLIRYHPGRFTRRMQREYQEGLVSLQARVKAGEEVSEDDTEVDAHWLMRLLDAEHPWNLTDDKDKPLKLSVKVLADEIGYVHMRRIIEAILADLVPTALRAAPTGPTA